MTDKFLSLETRVAIQHRWNTINSVIAPVCVAVVLFAALILFRMSGAVGRLGLVFMVIITFTIILLSYRHHNKKEARSNIANQILENQYDYIFQNGKVESLFKRVIYTRAQMTETILRRSNSLLTERLQGVLKEADDLVDLIYVLAQKVDEHKDLLHRFRGDHVLEFDPVFYLESPILSDATKQIVQDRNDSIKDMEQVVNQLYNRLVQTVAKFESYVPEIASINARQADQKAARLQENLTESILGLGDLKQALEEME